MTIEKILTDFAKKHSYATWDELMNDCHPHMQIAYTKSVMKIYAKQKVKFFIKNFYKNIKWTING